jgi:hypothetical protein
MAPPAVAPPAVAPPAGFEPAHTAPESVGGQARELPKRVSDRSRGPRLDHKAYV